jgi:hypothetical protein
MSSDKVYTKASITQSQTLVNRLVYIPKEGEIVAIACGEEWKLGKIVNISEDEEEVIIGLMNRDNRMFVWPRREQELTFETLHILQIVDCTKMKQPKSGSYVMTASVARNIQSKFETFRKKHS